MGEITKHNFKEKLPEIKKSLESAKFIALDLEFSALQPVEAPRLFNTNKERYATLRKNLMQVIPLQIGITAFQFNNETADFFGEVFTFYVSPANFGDINKTYYFQSSTTSFLCLYDFDFNKFAYSGIPYLNSEEEFLLRKKLESNEYFGENCQLHSEINDAAKVYFPIVSNWYQTSKVGDFLEIPSVKRYEHLYEIIYSFHKHLRSRFENLWTYEKNGSFYVKKVTPEELQILRNDCKLNESTINSVIGFKHVFNLLKQVRKPIIGHNLLQDLILMVHNFETPLPQSYSQFKTLTNSIFPMVFDTKSIYYELRVTIPKDKLPEDTCLKSLFRYFKDGLGRHLAVNTTAIESSIDSNKVEKYHDAGWDSFCTGYIFLRMGVFNISKNYPKNKKFTSAEILSGLSQYKNRVNVIRGATTHIRIDGEDPSSNRPPWLIVDSLKNEPVDVSDLMSLLSSYGFVDIKRISSSGRRVLVAVDNYRAARDISRYFKANPKFRVTQYSVLKHSIVAKAALLGAATVSGALLLWLGHSVTKRV